MAAADHLKQSLGTQTGMIEAIACPTLLYNGYGEHNIQGICDKHVPLIHNMMGSNFVIGVSDASCDTLNLVFNTTASRAYLSEHRGLSQEQISALGDLGLSSIANILGAIKYAKFHDLDVEDVVMTVATDGANMYQTELNIAQNKHFSNGFGIVQAAEAFGQNILGVGIDHMIELGRFDRKRIFNLAYYTWVELQGTSLENFGRRRDQSFWDDLLDKFNAAQMASLELLLTASHWGVYRPEVKDGKLRSLRPFKHDPDPSPIAQGYVGVLDDPLRITSPLGRKSWLENWPGSSNDLRGSDLFVQASWDEAEKLVADELHRVRTGFDDHAIYGGSYGWSGAGRLHHAKSQIHRFLNCIGGYTKSVNSHSLATGEVILSHILGNPSEMIHNPPSWQSVVDNSESLVAFGGMPL